jgi:hypothetical protein
MRLEEIATPESWLIPNSNDPAWVYNCSEERFFNLLNKQSVTKTGFDNIMGSTLLSDEDIKRERLRPPFPPSLIALNGGRTPKVHGVRYAPGKGRVYEEKNLVYANTYEAPDITDEAITPEDEENLALVKGHFAHILSDPKEQGMLLDWLSRIVQNPGKHANYAVVLQGTPGDGKTWFAEMMAAVMGRTNVRMLNAQTLYSSFSDWAQGQCMTCIEEIRLINEHNKYEVLNKIKPFITNDYVEVHPKGKAPFDAKNTTNYLLLTNHQDALPLDDGERRYMVLYSRWQRKDKLEAWKKEHPGYYQRLYDAIKESPHAIRRWLLGHKQAEDFAPYDNPPFTSAMGEMIELAKPEFVQDVEEIVDANTVTEVSEDLIIVDALNDYLNMTHRKTYTGKAANMMLRKAGYERIARQVKIDGRPRICYTKNKEKFMDGGEVSTYKIRDFLKFRKAICEEL